MSPTKKYDERELLKSISEGDEEAFAVLFHAHYQGLKAAITRFFADPMQLEDALQDTFIRVWLNRDQLPTIENLPGWLNTIASRICLNQIEKELTREKHQQNHQKNELTAREIPFEKIAAKEISQLVAEAVNNMPPARKQIYQMSRNDGMKPAEIANALSLSVNTVRNVLVTALKEIRLHLAANGHTLLVLMLPVIFFFFLSE